jgi:fatty-acyl-CoA synthase
MSQVMEVSPEDKILVMVPFYHCMGMVCGNLTALQGGSTIVIPSPTFNAKKSLETVQRHQCTMTIGVPTMFIEMIREKGLNHFDLGNFHKSLIAGSIVAKQLILDMTEHLGLWRTHIAYGMTETSPISFMIRKDHPLEKQSTTVGTIMDHVEAKIIAPDGSIVEIGEQGEYAIKGYSVMPGYYNNPEVTEKSIIDGWMMTGDLARFDEEGFLYIEGRIKDLIIRGGENISPKEIEEYVMEMPQVENVQVIGVPDPKFQEEICAVIKKKAGAVLEKEDILSYLKPKISHFKIPKYVKFVDGFPITVTGKLRKVEMIKEWVDETEQMTQNEIKEKYMIR